MRCDEVERLLPWLLNGTLPQEEAERVRDHLRGCAECRRAVVATGQVWELFASHPPASEVVAHALGTGRTSPEVAAHFERCATCRLEIALVREEPREEAAEPGEPSEATLRRLEAAPAPSAQARAGTFYSARAASNRGAHRRLALAAAVLAVLASAGWLLSWQRLRSAGSSAVARQSALEGRVAELEAALQRVPSRAAAAPTPSAAPPAPERIASLERELFGLRQPQGLAVVELLSEETVLRGGESPSPAVAHDRPAALLLVAEALTAGSRYRIRVGTGTTLWEGTVGADSAGVLPLYLPAASLPRGEHAVRVLTLDGGLVASYRLILR